MLSGVVVGAGSFTLVTISESEGDLLIPAVNSICAVQMKPLVVGLFTITPYLSLYNPIPITEVFCCLQQNRLEKKLFLGCLFFFLLGYEMSFGSLGGRGRGVRS